MLKSAYREVQTRLLLAATEEDGMSTAEYAIGMLYTRDGTQGQSVGRSQAIAPDR